jgi:hypothetical protein
MEVGAASVAGPRCEKPGEPGQGAKKQFLDMVCAWAERMAAAGLR